MHLNESLPALMQAGQRPLAGTLCLEASVGFMEHATSMIRLCSCWLSESAQTLSHHVLMKTNDLRGLPYSEASPQLSLRGTPDTAVWTPDQGSRKFCWGIRGLCSAVNCVVQQRHSIFWRLMIANFSTVCITSDRPRSGVEDETG